MQSTLQLPALHDTLQPALPVQRLAQSPPSQLLSQVDSAVQLCTQVPPVQRCWQVFAWSHELEQLVPGPQSVVAGPPA